MKKGGKIILTLLLVILVPVAALCIISGLQVFNATSQLSTNQATNLQQNHAYLESKGLDPDLFREQYTVKQIEIISTLDGHTIPADYIIQQQEDADTVILVHGLGGNRLSTYAMAKMFLELGCNVIAYDQRSAGENTAQYTTFGYWESRDLLDYIDYADARISADKKLIAWGVSFGGATTGIALGSETAMQKLDYAILDSPVSSMRDSLAHRMDEMELGLPTDFLLAMGNLANRIKLGFSYEDADVCRYTAQTTVPTLVINSAADVQTPYYMSKDIYDSLSNAAARQIFTVTDSGHAEIFFDYPAEYRLVVADFCGFSSTGNQQ